MTTNSGHIKITLHYDIPNLNRKIKALNRISILKVKLLEISQCFDLRVLKGRLSLFTKSLDFTSKNIPGRAKPVEVSEDKKKNETMPYLKYIV